MTEHPADRWPEGAIVYHIYPRSLQDSNGDGVGDLGGILQRLDYIQSLGATVIWLSPFYPSPMADFGYDVADYCAVDPVFGTMDDFDALLAACHDKGIKLMIDLVPNHTSDEHEWFRQSKRSADNPYNDWYIWRDAIGLDASGAPLPPNNWRDALTGGSAWQWDANRQQFYLHSFDVRQPDLNWSNPAVRSAIHDAMRFWLDKGVDGFRVDAVHWLAKEPLLSDDTPDPSYIKGASLTYDALLHDNSRGWPQVYAYLSEMADVLKEYTDSLRFMVTEAYPEGHNPLTTYLAFYVGVDPRVAAPFNFEGIKLSWRAGAWRKFLRSFHTALDQFNPLCVPSYAFGNHDQPRLIDRLGSEAAARSAAVLLLTLPGMAFVYYGEEIGMHNVAIPPNFVQDPAAKGDPAGGIGRDPERTPMQWSSEAQAGFTTGPETWLPVAKDYTERNVDVETSDSTSFLSLYRQLGRMRQEISALQQGKLCVIDTGHPDVLAYTRSDTDTCLVVINFSDSLVPYTIPEHATCLISSEPASMLSASGQLAAHEAVVLKLE